MPGTALPRVRLLVGPGTLHSRGADRMDFTRYSRSGNPRMTVLIFNQSVCVQP